MRCLTGMILLLQFTKEKEKEKDRERRKKELNIKKTICS